MLKRRRFLTLTACALGAGLPAGMARAGGGLHVAHGQALGARVTLRLRHPDAPAIADRALTEIARLEQIFSLYRRDSALMRLNADGQLAHPPFELLECLSLAGRVHEASGGLFDPTVQPLWAAYAETASRGATLSDAARAAALARTGWARVALSETRIGLAPGMALTLNGIAQGYIADRIAALLTAEGLDDLLIDTGELRALGGHPDGGDWPVTLAQGDKLMLRQRALASSAPLGTTFDAAGRLGHILNPRDGQTAPPRWRTVSVSAPGAGLADALSTALCLAASAAEAQRICAAFPKARIEALHAA
ncbi:FAD:protein FMN transferase [Gemmobacter caeruleus]|uniref:FAD:protein FMN transferase n=1 Tax=Gemmobacter caeruleus TaxID=2595004 RepID=UPI0011EFE495|nr:FAD:protein FMN transferase [Gemmobacter caeruleus]